MLDKTYPHPIKLINYINERLYIVTRKRKFYMEDTVSVIIPVYNSGKFLKESIESILAQSYENIEIIAVDDGSTDNSLEILNQFKSNIIVIHQKNQGLAGALNTGIEKMTGKWFKWFSPDDVMNPDAIEILVKKGREMGDTCIIYSNWEMIDKKGKFLRSFSESNYNDLDIFEFNVRLLDGQQINVNTTLIPAKLFSEGCKIRDLEDSIAIDYDFFLHAGLLYKVKFHQIEKPLIKYRIHSKQLSHQKILQSLSYIDKIKSEIMSKLDSDSRKKYEISLKEYQKQKSMTKKSLESGLKFLSATLPDFIVDKFLILYLNKIRSER